MERSKIIFISKRKDLTFMIFWSYISVSERGIKFGFCERDN